MTDSELSALRQILAGLAPHGRAALLPALHAAQRIFRWIPEPVAAEVARALGVPLADVGGVIDFYEMFHRRPVGRTIVRVCSAPICALAGAESVTQALCHDLKTELGDITPDGGFTVESAPCLGLCDLAPAVLVGENAVGHA
ncbi:MAG TPA: NAD(P)H-dependent oxidoreductase subunit E, partial [Candidatus Binatia bacterium]|nr:NAD(P)H-dependent oxidoreductase subunit E [Candidatus Binatia bacterium]